MAQEYLLSRIDEWAREGLISPEQAEALKQRELEDATVSVPARRVKADEILVYLGSLVVFLALAFLVGSNWNALGSGGRILSVLVPTVVMLALGWWLRGSEDARLNRGAQALLLGGCLLSGLSFGMIFDEMDLISDPYVLFLVSSLLATGIAGGAFALLPSIAQSVALHLCGSAGLFAFLNWLGHITANIDFFYQHLLVLASSLVVGGLWLALSEWLRTKKRKGPVGVSRIFGALTILGVTFFLAINYDPEYAAWHGYGYGYRAWHKTVFELSAFLASIAFIAASVKRQSQAYLYSGAAFLLFVITYVNLVHFADKIGMPVVLFFIGVLLIVLGLGTERLRRRIRATQ